MKDKEYYTIPEVAKIFGVSRIAMYKRVKKGEVKAVKIGRNYAIPKNYVDGILGKTLGRENKAEIDKAVRKIVAEYGDVLKLLGRE